MLPLQTNDDVWDHPNSKIHVDHMGPTWALSAPGGPHVGPMNLPIRGGFILTDLYVYLLITDVNHLPPGQKGGHFANIFSYAI